MIISFSVNLTLVLNATDMTLIMIKNGSTMRNIVRCMGGGVATLKDDKKSDTNMYRWTNLSFNRLKDHITLPVWPAAKEPIEQYHTVKP
jgi:hypothetical protein